jgi:DNA polymerase epsilon subunit 1
VALLRRQLLKLLHVSEFSTDADFREMCQPFVVPDVICGCGVRGGRRGE